MEINHSLISDSRSRLFFSLSKKKKEKKLLNCLIYFGEVKYLGKMEKKQSDLLLKELTVPVSRDSLRLPGHALVQQDYRAEGQLV